MSNIFIDPAFEEIYSEHPIVLIDVGAYGGINKRWAKAKRHLRAVAFEPDERAFKALPCDSQTTYINTAISDTDGQCKFYLTEMPGCSSIFPPNHEFIGQFPDAGRFGIKGTTTIPTRRLNAELLHDHGVSDPDFLKVDTQGGEMKVLRGAAELLESSIFGVEAELEFAPIYAGQPLFPEVDQFLRDKGFQLFGLKRYYWKRSTGAYSGGPKGQIVFADALYFKTYESLAKSIEKMAPEEKKAKILRAVSLCLIYGLSDYAIYLSEKSEKDGLLSSDDSRIIQRAVNRKSAAPFFKGKGLLGTIFYKAYKYCRSGEFHFADEEINNA